MRQKKLSEILDISIGRTPSRNNPSYWGKGNLWVSIRDLNSKTITETKEQITDLAVENARCKIVKKGTLLFSFKLTIGKMAFAGCDLFTNEAIAAFAIKDEKELNPEFLYYALQSATYGGSNQAVMGKTLNSKSLAEIEIPCPPLDDQIRIAHLLGKVEALITQRKHHLQQLDDLLKSVFLEMFGDPILNPHGFPVRRLSDFYVNPKEGTKCGPFGSALKKEELVDSGVPVWNMDNIATDGQMVLPFRMWITADKYDELAAYAVQDGDIIISRAGTVGKMCVARMNGQRAIISTNLIRLRLGDELRPLHFVSLMLYCKGRVGRLKTGADGAFTHMNTTVLDSLEFPYPPVEIQDRFGAISAKVKSAKSRYQQSLTELEALYGTLSQRAFKGELDLSRVPLPDQSVADVSIEEYAAEPEMVVQTEPAIHLPATDNLSATLENAEARKALMARWLEAYRTQLDGTPFSAQQFITVAQARLAELHPDHDIALGASDYENIKVWVFEQVRARRLKQTRDIILINNKRQFGNRLLLRARRLPDQ
ncbi:restriction endonuclease subunit S [Dickeya zeae]|uniref:restriction endonuclease subunit S n=1 Tax=Dickeya zeae TaxID=204042 RepID=UPI0003A3329F|nr:restriction endonuclease subunit S [Dickeya zeae]